jgi:hypothetical protein
MDASRIRGRFTAAYEEAMIPCAAPVPAINISRQWECVCRPFGLCNKGTARRGSRGPQARNTEPCARHSGSHRPALTVSWIVTVSSGTRRSMAPCSTSLGPEATAAEPRATASNSAGKTRPIRSTSTRRRGRAGPTGRTRIRTPMKILPVRPRAPPRSRSTWQTTAPSSPSRGRTASPASASCPPSRSP